MVFEPNEAARAAEATSAMNKMTPNGPLNSSFYITRARQAQPQIGVRNNHSATRAHLTPMPLWGVRMEKQSPARETVDGFAALAKTFSIPVRPNACGKGSVC